jgi:hypothetical protein
MNAHQLAQQACEAAINKTMTPEDRQAAATEAAAAYTAYQSNPLRGLIDAFDAERARIEQGWTS